MKSNKNNNKMNKNINFYKILNNKNQKSKNFCNCNKIQNKLKEKEMRINKEQINY